MIAIINAVFYGNQEVKLSLTILFIFLIMIITVKKKPYIKK